MKKHRQVAFTKRTIVQFDDDSVPTSTESHQERILPPDHIVLLGDVDNDPLQDSELVVGASTGILAIFKGDNSTPWAVADGLGQIGCLTLGKLLYPLSPRKQLAVISHQGAAHLLEVCWSPELQLRWKQSGKALAIKPVCSFACPCNVTSATVWERDKPKSEEQTSLEESETIEEAAPEDDRPLLILGSANGEVWIFSPKTQLESSENPIISKLTLLKKFQVGAPITNVVIVPSLSHSQESPTLIVALQSGSFEAVDLDKVLDIPGQQIQLPLDLHLEVEAGKGLTTSIWGWEGGLSVAGGDATSDAKSTFAVAALDGRLAWVDVVGANNNSEGKGGLRWQVRWSLQGSEPWGFVGLMPYPNPQLPDIPSDSFPVDSSRRSDEGKWSERESSVEPEVPMSALIAACSWGGRTFLMDNEGNSVEFDAAEALGLGEGNCEQEQTLQAFAAGPLSLHPGRAEPCLVYVSSRGQITVFHQLFQQIGPIQMRSLKSALQLQNNKVQKDRITKLLQHSQHEMIDAEFKVAEKILRGQIVDIC